LPFALAFCSYAPVATLVYALSLHDALPISSLLVPASKNSTLAIEPSESEAVAWSVTLAGAVNTELFAGLVMLTAGGTSTVMLARSEEHTTQVQSRSHAVCRQLLDAT